MALTIDDLTQEIFEKYGMTELPPIEAFKLLDDENPEIIIWTGGDAPIVTTKFYTTELYWAVSGDKMDWFIYKNDDWFKVDATTFFKEEFTAKDILTIPGAAWAKISVDKKVYFKACLITNCVNKTPAVNRLHITAEKSFGLGSGYVISGPELIMDTRLWTSVSKVIINADQPPDTNIRFAFGLNTTAWFVLKGGQWTTMPEEKIYANGMRAEDVAAITERQWGEFLGPQLKVLIGMENNNQGRSPVVTSIDIEHVSYENPTISNVVTLSIPTEVYNRNVFSPENLIYEEQPVEGIGFDDAEDLYNFYTTPNKIKLRVLNMGTLIGTHTSEIFKAVIVNTWAEKNFDIKLEMRLENGDFGIPYGTYCLLKDSLEEASMTKAEFSLQKGDDFNPIYPLRFHLAAGQRKIFYFRLLPTTTTTGNCKVIIAATSLQTE